MFTEIIYIKYDFCMYVFLIVIVLIKDILTPPKAAKDRHTPCKVLFLS